MSDTEKISIGLDVDLACALCYAGGPLTGLLFLLLEKKDHLVRFHALQSSIVFAPAAVLLPILFLVPFSEYPAVRFIIYTFAGVLCLVTVGMLVWVIPGAYRLERKRFPIVGKWVDRFIPNDGTSEAMKMHGE